MLGTQSRAGHARHLGLNWQEKDILLYSYPYIHILYPSPNPHPTINILPHLKIRVNQPLSVANSFLSVPCFPSLHFCILLCHFAF